MQSLVAPAGLHSSRAAVPEEQASIEETRWRNRQTIEAQRERKWPERKELLRKEDQRWKWERRERRGEEVGSDLESSTDDEGNEGGHSPLLDEPSVLDFVTLDQPRVMKVDVEALPPPPPGAPPAGAIHSPPPSSSGERILPIRRPGSSGK